MLRTVQQYYPDPVTGKLKPGFIKGIKTSEGVYALLQKVAHLILTRPGSNFYDGTLGNILAIAIGGVQSRDEHELRLKAQLGLKEVETTIKQEQQFDTNIEPEERLIELRMIRFQRDPQDFTNLEIDVLVITEANQTFLLRV
jgi:hypothetical protein